jgi:hypothetical protein
MSHRRKKGHGSKVLRKSLGCYTTHIDAAAAAAAAAAADDDDHGAGGGGGGGGGEGRRTRTQKCWWKMRSIKQ